ncbi:hypothetical protein OESDEN_06464 [Oesophagostomum dentatum]|uniref:Uncharacterized protein n=1 Tax=Oesophagostomum dentatum TaxID=61180 RepID=A0A0B1T7X5_OESDE|nr:hypothetical protein OESDEN_06464 [Oesophagostomum dentatum]
MNQGLSLIYFRQFFAESRVAGPSFRLTTTLQSIAGRVLPLSSFAGPPYSQYKRFWHGAKRPGLEALSLCLSSMKFRYELAQIFDYLMLTRIYPTAVCRADDDSGELSSA